MQVLSIGSDRNILDRSSIAYARQKAYAEALGALTSIVFATGQHDEIRDGALHVIPTNSWSRFSYGWSAWRIARRVPRPDVVSVQDPFETGLVGFVIARRFGVPLHAQLHTDPYAPGFARSVSNRIRRWIAPFVLRRTARVRTVSETIAERLDACGIATPATVLPIFADVSRLEIMKREKHPRWKIDIAFVGRLEREKRPDIALRALAAARKAGHDVGLTIAGAGSEERALRALAQSLHVADRIEFLGWQSDVRHVLARADLVLVPSVYEGYSMTTVEALAAGVPVIATDVGIAREAGAIVVKAKDMPREVIAWMGNGPRQGTLASDFRAAMPATFAAYVDAYVADMRACIGDDSE
jgi:glycosyltransferase involved in cell wall biosynthesis